MKSTVICRKSTTAADTLCFYLKNGGKEYFLFSQRFYQNIFDYFKNGVALGKALSYKGVKRSPTLMKVVDKFIPYIRYIEKEEKIVILDKDIGSDPKNKSSVRKCIREWCCAENRKYPLAVLDLSVV